MAEDRLSANVNHTATYGEPDPEKTLTGKEQDLDPDRIYACLRCCEAADVIVNEFSAGRVWTGRPPQSYALLKEAQVDNYGHSLSIFSHGLQ